MQLYPHLQRRNPHHFVDPHVVAEGIGPSAATASEDQVYGGVDGKMRDGLYNRILYKIL